MRTTLAVLFCLFFITLPFPCHADIVIGAFSNAGTSCSFSGNNAGLVTAHVVVRSDGAGFRGVRFAAPIPDCFDAVFVQETVPDGIFSIGDSQTGISIAVPDCFDLPKRVLDITYFTSGGTAPCCEFSFVPDPLVGYLQAVDCALNEIPMQSLTSYMNADSSCACSVYEAPPYPPANPYPAHGATWVERNLTLRWSCADPANLDIYCDLYFGTTPEPPLVATDIPGYTNFSHILPRLSPDTMYYWRIVAHNVVGGETAGPMWQFSTGPNSIPFVQLLQPAYAATLQPLVPTLTWNGADDTPLTYDVFLGTDPSALPKVVSATRELHYSPPPLQWQTTYYWRVSALDIDGGVGVSETWLFTTRPQTLPPNPPSSPSPANNASNISVTPTLGWQCSDPDGNALTYDVYFGTATDPPLVATNRTVKWYSPGLLQTSMSYYWRIVARNSRGLTTSGPVWVFNTILNRPPNAPASPVPPNGSIGRPVNQTLTWTCTDPDGQALVYDVYFGTTSTPPLVASNLTARSHYPGAQSFLTKYYWRVVARDTHGAQTSGPTWSYTTKATDEPPGAPGSPVPANGATNQPVNRIVTWNASDPEGQPLNFDVYFGTDASPPLVADHITAKSFDPGPLAISTTYRWRVLARDPAGQETSGATWSFTTAATASLPPNPPSNPSPADGGNTTDNTPLLSWQCSDPDGDVLQYTVYMFVYDTFPDYVWTTNTPYLQVTEPLPSGWPLMWFVEAYDGHWRTQNSTWWSFVVSGGNVAVAIRSFTARQNGLGIDVSWELASDEPLESYTLYRRVKHGEQIVVGRGVAERASGSYRDESVVAGNTYSYELVIQSSGGEQFRSQVATVTMAKIEVTLHQNVPNPFNPQTSIRYDLPSAAHVRLAIFDVNGHFVRTLVDEDQTPGSREVLWTGLDDNGVPVSTGVYFYVLDAGKQRLTRKLVLLK